MVKIKKKKRDSAVLSFRNPLPNQRYPSKMKKVQMQKFPFWFGVPKKIKKPKIKTRRNRLKISWKSVPDGIFERSWDMGLGFLDTSFEAMGEALVLIGGIRKRKKERENKEVSEAFRFIFDSTRRLPT